MICRADNFQDLGWQVQVIDRTIWDVGVARNVLVYFVVLLSILWLEFSSSFRLTSYFILILSFIILLTLTFIHYFLLHLLILHFIHPFPQTIYLLQHLLYFELTVFSNVDTQLIHDSHVIKDWAIIFKELQQMIRIGNFTKVTRSQDQYQMQSLILHTF